MFWAGQLACLLCCTHYTTLRLLFSAYAVWPWFWATTCFDRRACCFPCNTTVVVVVSSYIYEYCNSIAGLETQRVGTRVQLYGELYFVRVCIATLRYMRNQLIQTCLV